MVGLKAQLREEFMICLIAFILIGSYLFSLLVNSLASYSALMRRENLLVEAALLSELLIQDPGEPKDWEMGNVRRIGFANHTSNLQNLVSLEKIQKTQELCEDYERVKKLIGSLNDFNLIFYDENNQEILRCEPEEKISTPLTASITRITAYSSQKGIGYGKLLVRMF